MSETFQRRSQKGQIPEVTGLMVSSEVAGVQNKQWMEKTQPRWIHFTQLEVNYLRARNLLLFKWDVLQLYDRQCHLKRDALL